MPQRKLWHFLRLGGQARDAPYQDCALGLQGRTGMAQDGVEAVFALRRKVRSPGTVIQADPGALVFCLHEEAV